MRHASLLALACCVVLSGCGVSANPVAPRGLTAVPAPTLAARGEAAKLGREQVRAALALIGDRLYKDFEYDFQHNDSAIARKTRNNQGNLDWLVVREFRVTDKPGQYAFLANEYTKDDAGVMQSQYKLTGVVDLKANQVVDIRKEVEDRDPR